MAKLVNVKVNPMARLNKIEEDGAGGYTVWTTAPSDQGAANAAVVLALAEYLRVPRSAITLRRGSTSRRKAFEIEI